MGGYGRDKIAESNFPELLEVIREKKLPFELILNFPGEVIQMDRISEFFTEADKLENLKYNVRIISKEEYKCNCERFKTESYELKNLQSLLIEYSL